MVLLTIVNFKHKFAVQNFKHKFAETANLCLKLQYCINI